MKTILNILLLSCVLHSKQYFSMPIGKIDADKAEMLRGVLNKSNTYKICNANNLENCINCFNFDNLISENQNHKTADRNQKMCNDKHNLLQLTKTSPKLVNLNTTIPKAEEYFIGSVRNTKAYTDLATLLNIYNKINIAFCFSGGGARATISSLGSLNGAANIKYGDNVSFFDMITYAAGVSGSTWAIALRQSGHQDFPEIKSTLQKTLSTSPFALEHKEAIKPNNTLKLDDKHAANLLKALITKSLFKQHIGHADIWGEFGRNILSLKQAITITDTQVERMLHGAMPFPIYTAVESSTKHWFEITPISAGFTDSSWIPLWALNREFNNGYSVGFPSKVHDKATNSKILVKQHAPEQPLSFILGITKSDYPINLTNIINVMAKMDLDKTIKNDPELATQSDEFKKNYKIIAGMVLKYLKRMKKNLTASAKIFNFTYGIKDSPFKNNQYFELEDGSASFSLAIPPLLKPSRKIDVIFILDSSNNTPEPNITELQKAFAWAKENNKPFQDITKYPNLSTSSITVMDDNKNAPIMVYMPLIKDQKLSYTGNAEKFDLKKCMEGECEQTNYKYTVANFNGLWDLAQQNITLNQDKIETVLKSASDRIENRPWYQGALFGTTQ